MCRKLILQGKGPLSGDYIPDRQSLAQQYAFDKSKEVERKNALIMLFNRTKEQVEEEEALFVEAKRIEMNEARLSRERESLLNSLKLEQIQPVPSTPNTPVHTSPGGLASPGGIGITGGTAGGAHSDLKVNICDNSFLYLQDIHICVYILISMIIIITITIIVTEKEEIKYERRYEKRKKIIQQFIRNHGR